jgi:hypothetical protein
MVVKFYLSNNNINLGLVQLQLFFMGVFLSINHIKYIDKKILYGIIRVFSQTCRQALHQIFI